MVSLFYWKIIGKNMPNFEKIASIEGISYVLGDIEITNSHLAKENPDWEMSKVVERAGVIKRYVAGEGQTALDLSFESSKDLLTSLNLQASDIDALLYCTQSPDYLLPPNSSLLHRLLDMSNNVMAFDISHACSGFIYALGIANSLIKSNTASRVLVITADTYSRYINPSDRSIRPLFGDAAASTIISASSKMYIKDIIFGTSGKHADRFILKNGGRRNSSYLFPNEYAFKEASGKILEDDYISMNGIGILSFFNYTIPHSVRQLLQRNNKTLDDVECFVFHQASLLALEGLAKNLKIPSSKMIIDLAETGNLVSASIPVALKRVMAERTFNSGDLLILCGFGVGLSWGTALIEY